MCKTYLPGIPEEMKKFNNWVLYKLVEDAKRPGHKQKKPYSITGSMAKANDAKTWASWEDALKAYQCRDFDGLGFEFGGSGLVGVDIDGCIDANGTITEAARYVLDTIDSYAEISQSGSGVHIICRGSMPGQKHRKGAFEMYANGRFFALTGNVIKGHEDIADAQQGLQVVYDTFIDTQPQLKDTAKDCPAGKQAAITAIGVAGSRFTCDALTEEEIINIISNGLCKGGSRLQKLWAGDWSDYRSQSEADAALCAALAFYCRRDAAMIDGIFRKSKLYREKWNESRNGSNYGYITVDAACRSCQKMYGEAIPYPVLDADGDPLKSSWENLQFFLEQQHRLVYWNVITRRIVDSNGEAIDFDVFCASLWGKANKAGLPVSLQDIKALLPVVAACHSFNPWSDYLTGCRDNVVDGADYIGQMAAALQLDYSVEQDAATVTKYLTKWLVQACQLAFNAEGMVMPQHILVFAGQGGIGKTRFVKWLMQERPQLVATGAAISPDNKDSIMAATEFGIVEVGELPRSMKAKDALKAFFTQSTDVLRKPYARGVQSFPRYTSYIATTNDRRVLLDDVGAGDRRYLCIALKDIDWKALQSISPAKVWGQSMYLAFEKKLPYWLSREEIAALNHSNLQFRKRTAFEQSVYDKLDWQNGARRFTTAAALCEELGFRIENCNHVSRVLNNMVAAGEIAKPVQQGKAMEYSLPPTKRLLFCNDYTVGNTGIK